MKKQIKKTKWTLFWDMHSGGSSKEKWDKIYIEAPKIEARIIFYNRFGHNPERTTCTCCGDDYSIDEDDSLEESSGFHRNCRSGYLDKKGKEIHKDKAWKSGIGLIDNAKDTYFEEDDKENLKRVKAYGGDFWRSKKHIPLKDYIKDKNVLVIYAKDIKSSERVGKVPEQGYVWKN